MKFHNYTDRRKTCSIQAKQPMTDEQLKAYRKDQRDEKAEPPMCNMSTTFEPKKTEDMRDEWAKAYIKKYSSWLKEGEYKEEPAAETETK